ncbi:hypothetical protein J1N35_021882 [Gossypium stocksii]|uniref:Uncharacterized protein n=1 Tax=Gossypium stocksii TaxID=47602 RepID=A0A9D3VFC5_9ROSI|nr:hypothetical protein J1N35_021882 [Gossypium stocksii]
MNQVIRSVRAQSPTIFSLQSLLLYRSSTTNLKSITSSGSRPKTPRNMDQKSENSPKAMTGDVMSRSFGDGYSTRSDDERFGGTIGGSQSSL